MASAFAAVLQKGLCATHEIINQLSEIQSLKERTLDPELLTSFPSLLLTTDMLLINGRRKLTDLRTEPHPKGSFGTCYVSQSAKNVYKHIVLDESDLREVLVEIYIQTVLAHNSVYICKPLRVYRSMDVVRHSRRLAPSTTTTPSLFVEMEYIPYSFSDYMHQLRIANRVGAKLETEDISLLFVYLATVLDILWTKYAFIHGDLHVRNIMFSHYGKIKLIDFGFSSLSHEGRVYNADMTYPPTKSYDILMFLCSFMSEAKYYCTPAAVEWCKSLFNMQDGRNLYTIMETVAEAKGKPVFHMAYYSQLVKYKFLKKVPSHLVDYDEFIRRVSSPPRISVCGRMLRWAFGS